MLALLYCLFLLGCNNNDIPNHNQEGFWMQVGTTYVPNSKIDYYDFSTHTVYFKEEQSFFRDSDRGTFSVYVGDSKIYMGGILPMSSDYAPAGIYINSSFMNKPQYELAINFRQYGSQEIEDFRSDSRIIDALKSEGKYHAGLQVEIQSIRFLPNDKVSFDFQLTNNDTFNYLYLDPDKTGIGLFHYFTNGLSFYSEKDNQRYNPKISIVSPDSWNVWKKEWLSVIQSGESKQFTITYDQFDPMPAGNYQASFYFPGLQFYQVEMKDLNQKEGRIWLGSIDSELNCSK